MSGNHPKLILDGTKIMTRRTYGLEYVNKEPDRWQFLLEQDGIFYFTDDGGKKAQTGWHCPYGQVGDRLGVKETHYRWGHWAKNGFSKTGKQKWTFKTESKEVYYSDNPPSAVQRNSFRGTAWYKRPSIFLPKEYIRIWLEITEVRVERVKSITEEDAQAEGVRNQVLSDFEPNFNIAIRPASDVFKELWDSLNAKRGYSWEVNSWVWCISFKVVK